MKYGKYIALAIILSVFAYFGNMVYAIKHEPPVVETVQVEEPTKPVNNTPKEPMVADFDQAVLLNNTNEHRRQNNLPALSVNLLLNNSALAKCNDMVTRNYWSHYTPDGQAPWVFIKQAGITYRTAGENLAFGYKNSKDVIDGWISSPTHNKNLLEVRFNQVGFGICKSQRYVGDDPKVGGGPAVIVVQHFISQ